MKQIGIFIGLAGLVLALGFPLLAGGLLAVALVQLVNRLPDGCNKKCNQGRACACQKQQIPR